MKITYLGIAGLGFICAITVCRKGYHPRLVEYLKAEQRLRDRISEAKGLSDSLQALQAEFRIDRDKELERLRDDPDQWVEVLKALRNED